MTREEFKKHVEEAIETAIQEAEKRVSKQFVRHYCYQNMGSKTEPVPEEQMAGFITQLAYVDSDHIFPCFDLGVGDILDDGRLLLIGYRAAVAPCPWGKNWQGGEGPFIRIMGGKFLEKFHVS